MNRHIPNIFTLGNLFCGLVSIIFVVKENYLLTGLIVIIGIFFDFLDGFLARILNVKSELGKQLDSLADMVTSGVVPGIIMFNLLKGIEDTGFFGENLNTYTGSFLPYLGFLLSIGACYRLANFNIDDKQINSFIGLPTPAMCLFIISLPIISNYSSEVFFVRIVSNKWFLIIVTFFLTYLMNSKISLFSLKFKNFSFIKNLDIVIFLILAVFLFFLLKFVAIPIIIIMYIIISLVRNKYFYN